MRLPVKTLFHQSRGAVVISLEGDLVVVSASGCSALLQLESAEAVSARLAVFLRLRPRFARLLVTILASGLRRFRPILLFHDGFQTGFFSPSVGVHKAAWMRCERTRRRLAKVV